MAVEEKELKSCGWHVPSNHPKGAMRDEMTELMTGTVESQEPPKDNTPYLRVSSARWIRCWTALKDTLHHFVYHRTREI